MGDMSGLLREHVNWKTRSKKDVYPLLERPDVRMKVLEEAERRVGSYFDVVAGLEATGMVVGSLLADRVDAPYVPVRRRSKWPYKDDELVIGSCKDYSDSTKCFAIRRDAFSEGDRVLIVDDWIETGAQCACAKSLVRRGGGVVAEVFVLVDEVADDDDVTSLAVLE